jgi:hypothetical protein
MPFEQRELPLGREAPAQKKSGLSPTHFSASLRRAPRPEQKDKLVCHNQNTPIAYEIQRL